MLRIFKGFSIRTSVLAFTLGGFLWGEASFATVIEKLEATVNNQLVLRSDIARFRRTIPLRAQLDPLFNGSPLAREGAKADGGTVLEFLIDEQIILQQFPMTDAEVEQEIGTIQANNRISREQLREAIRSQGFSFEDYFELIRVGAAKRNLIDREIRTKVTVSDDEVRNYYYGTFAKGQSAPPAYHVQIISQKDRSKIADAHRAVKNQEDFASVAKRYSEDSSAETGGELGTFTAEQMNPLIRSELKKLKVGETSPILGNAKTGFFFVRLASIGAGDDARLQQASEQIRAQLAGGEYQRQLELWLERQRQAAFIRRAGDPPAAGLPKGL